MIRTRIQHNLPISYNGYRKGSPNVQTEDSYDAYDIGQWAVVSDHWPIDGVRRTY